MKRTIAFLIFLVFTLHSSLFTLYAQTISLDDVLNYKYYPQGVSGLNPMDDGVSFAKIENGRIERYSYQTGEHLGTVIAPGKQFSRYTISPDGNYVLLCQDFRSIYRHSGTANYLLYKVSDGTFTQLSTTGRQECPRFSPDSRRIGYVIDNNLYVKDIASGKETQVTNDGKFNFIINGKPDWVYEEEFSFDCAFTISADGRHIAWIRFDESKVKTFSFPWYKGMSPEKKDYTLYTGSYDYKYPKAGEDNSKVSVLSYDIETGKTTTMNVPLDEDGYIPRIHFTDHADKLAVLTLNRLQSHFRIYLANPSTGVSDCILKEDAYKYFDTDLYSDIDFSHDQFVLLNDRDGHNHLYLYGLDGKLIRQLTKGDYDVTSYGGCDAKGKEFYFTSTEGNPLEQYVCKVDLKGRKTVLTPQKGFNKASFSKGCQYFVNTFSDLNTPPVYSVFTNKGKILRVLEDNAKLKETYASDRTFGKAELFSFTTSEGVSLNGWMLKPYDFDASRKYPVLMYQYSGPGSQEVHNSWDNGFFNGLTWEHRLSQKGYIVVCVDGRGTGGRGAEWKKCTYERLCDLESKDQVEAAIWLGRQPFVDKERIAIWGWSFGGENTLMSMSEGRPVFCCGVAVAPVTSNRFYDTVYTERYMGLPKDNAKGYDDNAITRVGKLHGDILLCHGYADDNVHFQNMAEYTEALVQAGIQFESQFYVNRNHGISGGNTRRHLFTRIESFLDSHLRP